MYFGALAIASSIWSAAFGQSSAAPPTRVPASNRYTAAMASPRDRRRARPAMRTGRSSRSTSGAITQARNRASTSTRTTRPSRCVTQTAAATAAMINTSRRIARLGEGDPPLPKIGSGSLMLMIVFACVTRLPSRPLGQVAGRVLLEHVHELTGRRGNRDHRAGPGDDRARGQLAAIHEFRRVVVRAHRSTLE